MNSLFCSLRESRRQHDLGHIILGHRFFIMSRCTLPFAFQCYEHCGEYLIGRLEHFTIDYVGATLSQKSIVVGHIVL